MLRSLRVMALLCLPASGCIFDAPCTPESPDGPSPCTGHIVIDAASDPPSFSLEGLSEEGPDRLEVRPDADCGGAGAAIWEVESIPAGVISYSYGVVPDGAREVIEPGKLVEGVTYSVTFWASTNGGGVASSDWGGFFTMGDPESGMTQSDFCGE